MIMDRSDPVKGRSYRENKKALLMEPYSCTICPGETPSR